MLLMNRLLNIAIAFKPPPSKSELISEELKKKRNKLFVIMVAIVKIKKIEIKVRKKLCKRRKNINYIEMNKILNIKGTQSTTNFNGGIVVDTDTDRKMPELNSSRKVVTNHGLRNSRFLDDLEAKNNGGKSALTPREYYYTNASNRNISNSRQTNFSKYKIQSNSMNSLALVKCNYHLKQDIIYGDKKLKMSGKNVLPEKLPKDLKNINRLVKLAHSLTLKNAENGDESQNNTPTYMSTSKLDTHRNSIVNPNMSSNLRNLQDLVVLDLSTERQSCLNFPLISIPIELFKLSQLKRLHFDCNQIKFIPDEFGTSMINLETLTISNNRLKWLPQTFKNLKKLQSLHLSHNRFDLFPEVLCQMPRLRFLDLSTNNIDALPAFIGDIVDLESLLLFHNNIKEVPRGIGNLKNLRTLWLGENKIRRLPKEITKLKYLDWNEDSFYLSSNLGGNPLEEPPLHVCLKGIHEIRIYFQENTITRNSNYTPNAGGETTSRLSNASPLMEIRD